jgi:hypothetical protein
MRYVILARSLRHDASRSGRYRRYTNQQEGSSNEMLRPLVAFTIFGLVAVCGCGTRSDKLPVSGEIKLDGVPLETGAIRLTSIGDARVQATGAFVENGQFDIPQSKGLSPGTYHVEINSPNDDAPPIMDRATPGGPGIPTQPDRIPPEFNINSKQRVEVTADGENHFVFDVKTGVAK